MASQHQYRSGIICAALFAAALTVTNSAQAGGDRRDEQMAIIARDLSDQDIADLAAYYASITFTVTVPE